MFGIDSVPRTGLDWLLAALAGAVLVALVGIGAYGAFTGFCSRACISTPMSGWR